MQRLADSSLNMVCDFQTEDDTLLADGAHPEIWLIQGTKDVEYSLK